MIYYTFFFEKNGIWWAWNTEAANDSDAYNAFTAANPGALHVHSISSK